MYREQNMYKWNKKNISYIFPGLYLPKFGDAKKKRKVQVSCCNHKHHKLNGNYTLCRPKS